MKKLLLLLLLSTGCSMLFSPDKYKPIATPKPVVEEVEETEVKPDTVKTIIIIE